MPRPLTLIPGLTDYCRALFNALGSRLKLILLTTTRIRPGINGSPTDAKQELIVLWMSSYQDLYIYHHGIMSSIFFHLPCPVSSWDASLSKRHGKPHFSPTGSGSSLKASGPRNPDASKTSTKTSFSLTGVGRCFLAGGLLLVKDRMQDFFMSVGSWEMANGRWHIGQ